MRIVTADNAVVVLLNTAVNVVVTRAGKAVVHTTVVQVVVVCICMQIASHVFTRLRPLCCAQQQSLHYRNARENISTSVYISIQQ
jgi:hypothetical protein